jgi:hypothetical protein
MSTNNHVSWVNHDANSHSSEEDTQPIVFLISKQDAPYQTCGGMCCPGVYSKDSVLRRFEQPHAMTVLTNSTIPIFAQTKTSVLTRSNHISTDGR